MLAIQVVCVNPCFALASPACWRVPIPVNILRDYTVIFAFELWPNHQHPRRNHLNRATSPFGRNAPFRAELAGACTVLIELCWSPRFPFRCSISCAPTPVEGRKRHDALGSTRSSCIGLFLYVAGCCGVRSLVSFCQMSHQQLHRAAWAGYLADCRSMHTCLCTRRAVCVAECRSVLKCLLPIYSQRRSHCLCRALLQRLTTSTLLSRPLAKG